MSTRTKRNILLALAVAVAILGIWKYRQPHGNAGEPMQDIAITLANGQTAKLSDLRGKYVLVQFWGSWCGPCRMENRQIVPLYQKFHGKGFEIFSIGQDVSENAWKSAIKSDGMVWPYHTMESANLDGPLARQFNIKSIPSTYLINPEGVIMGVNLDPVYINRMLEEKLK